MNNTTKFYLVPSLMVLMIILALPVAAKTKMEKSEMVQCSNEPAVYLKENNKSVKVFPDEQTFYSYGYEFAQVIKLDCANGLPFPVNGTVQNKFGQGFRLIKKTDDPSVFACEKKQSYYVCDKVLNADQAVQLYGQNWPKQIYETPASSMDMLVWHWTKKSYAK